MWIVILFFGAFICLLFFFDQRTGTHNGLIFVGLIGIGVILSFIGKLDNDSKNKKAKEKELNEQNLYKKDEM
jgi:hypothetical protein